MVNQIQILYFLHYYNRLLVLQKQEQQIEQQITSIMKGEMCAVTKGAWAFDFWSLPRAIS